MAGMMRGIPDELKGCHYRAHFDNEHHWVLNNDSRIELPERINDGSRQNRGIRERLLSNLRNWVHKFLENLSSVHEQMLENRPEAQSREERESSNDENCGDEETAEERSRHGEGTYGCGDGFLPGEISRNRHDRDDHEETSEELSRGCGRVVPQGISVEPAE